MKDDGASDDSEYEITEIEGCGKSQRLSTKTVQVGMCTTMKDCVYYFNNQLPFMTTIDYVIIASELKYLKQLVKVKYVIARSIDLLIE